jgi:hypothetical protein
MLRYENGEKSAMANTGNSPGKIRKENWKPVDMANVLAGIRSRYILMHSTSTTEPNTFG